MYLISKKCYPLSNDIHWLHIKQFPQLCLLYFLSFWYYYFTSSEFFTTALVGHLSQWWLLFLLFWEFFWGVSADGFSQEFEWQQVSLTLLSILANLDNTVVWMVSTCPLISKSSSSFTNSLGIIPSAPITIGITVIFMFPRFFSSLARSRYLSLFSLSFNFTLWSAGRFFFCWLSLGLVLWLESGDLFILPGHWSNE